MFLYNTLAKNIIVKEMQKYSLLVCIYNKNIA